MRSFCVNFLIRPQIVLVGGIRGKRVILCPFDATIIIVLCRVVVLKLRELARKTNTPPFHPCVDLEHNPPKVGSCLGGPIAWGEHAPPIANSRCVGGQGSAVRTSGLGLGSAGGWIWSMSLWWQIWIGMSWLIGRSAPITDLAPMMSDMKLTSSFLLSLNVTDVAATVDLQGGAGRGKAGQAEAGGWTGKRGRAGGMRDQGRDGLGRAAGCGGQRGGWAQRGAGCGPTPDVACSRVAVARDGRRRTGRGASAKRSRGKKGASGREDQGGRAAVLLEGA